MPPTAPRRLAAALAATLIAAVAPAVAQANGSKANGRYDVSLAGIEVGKAALVIDIDPAGYTAAASARVTGIAQIVTDGNGRSGSRGVLVKERVQPSSFAVTASGDDKTVEVQFAIDKAGLAKDIVLTPPPTPRPDRVPVTDAHRKGVLDPMSALLMPVAGTGEPLSAEACARTLPIFDGLARYDLTLSFLRIEAVKAKGYEGAAVVCRVAFKAIAGHREGRKDIAFMEKNKDIYVWLVPVAGSRVMVPFRIQVATRLGTLLVNARVFTTEAVDARAAAPAASNAATSRGGITR